MDANEKFLRIISQIESSGGKNTEHKTIKSGIHKGDRAIGEYGLMPKTLETLNRRNRRKSEFGPDEAIVSKLKGPDLEQFLSDNPRIQKNYAEDLSDYVLNRVEGDEDKAAYLWNQGQYTPLEKLTDRKLDKADYVQKFRKIRELMDKQYAK